MNDLRPDSPHGVDYASIPLNHPHSHRFDGNIKAKPQRCANTLRLLLTTV